MNSARWMVIGGLIALAVSSAAQARERRKTEKPPLGSEVVKEGKILVVRGLQGGEPQLTDEGGKRWLVVGVLREEVLQLEGHKIKVWASIGEKKLMIPTLDVKRYEILESGGGRKPVVGLLRRDAPRVLVLERQEGPLAVKGSRAFLEQLDKRVGCKVWLVGDVDDRTISAFKFGWLSCKTTPKLIKPGKENKR